MKLRIDTIPEAGLDLEGLIDPSEIGLDLPNYRLNEPLAFTGHAVKTEDDVYVEGRLQGAVEADCSRCLEKMSIPIDLEVNVMYVPREKLPDEENGTIEPESNIDYYVGDTIDLLQEIRDLLLVNLPIKAVCREDCKGLCSFCGTNLNISGCDCHDRSAGSPFEKLEELKKRMQGE
ncbi:MAG: DUF177 domain-containing protein [Candidatus Abyssobacteria bacterium SURF_5]|uniref:DUF177 domain-containing protein n=1 Tax=Abyssobacteria bacterium (strain SURF_5) TaxID=2093360 RepID=A0A3A4NAY4_ABYX5|nr:MAG: DUF177 domain-containing protein [Candidatus Abyssubacteria bacterium SURF_5]